MLSIFRIPAFNDNYIWALVDDDRQQAIIIDPGDATPVLAFLAQRKLTIGAILITHKHHDHTGGIQILLDAFPDVPVFANSAEGVAHTTKTVLDSDVITINKHAFTVIAIPGHTLGHVAYYCPPYLFCGDTLFGNGCGRIFEGTAQQMLSSLQKLMALPDDTQIYCGHEYTLSNIKFALDVEPDNSQLQNRLIEAKKLRSENNPTVPSLLQLEKATNPFLRCSEPAVIEAVTNYAGKQLRSEVEVFATLRQWKNAF
jgi:hydroxyacylglutathione hydrolase